MVLFLLLIIAVVVILYRNYKGQNVSKFITEQAQAIYDKFAPYSYKVVREKTKQLGQEYTARQYLIQVLIMGGFAGIVTYMYFYNLVVSVIYVLIAVAFIPYLSFLRCKRVYSEFIFEQIQVYTTNTIMEFGTTQSFVKALEGVYSSNVLEDPVKSDVKMMIDMAYQNGTIEQSINYMNSKYDFYIVRNMHQLFLQITNEGSRDAGESLENMSQDIDMLVESVYRDRIDRATFHKKFLQFGIILYLMVMLVQFMLGMETYNEMLTNWWVQVLLHGIIWLNTFFILSGEKYYNEDVGAE